MSEIKFTQLDAVKTEDLINTLLQRFDHAVFMGVQNETDEDEQIYRHYIGDYYTNIGMCMDLLDYIQFEEYQDCMEEIDDED